MRSLPFEYDERWSDVGPELEEAIAAGDEVRWRAIVALLEKKDRDLEDYLANLSTGEACGCSWVYASAANESLNLVADTDTSVNMTWTSINEGSDGWGISGGDLVAPEGDDADALYLAIALGVFGSSSGDPVNGAIALNAGFTAWKVAGYMADGFPIDLQVSAFTTIQSLNVQLALEAPAAASRSVDVGAEIKLWKMCGCTYIGGSG